MKNFVVEDDFWSLFPNAIGNEDFITLGTDKNEPPYEDKIVYKDNDGAICNGVT